MSREISTCPLRLRHYPGHLEPEYAYTLGIAGERFFREIKENARIMGAKCKKCGRIYVPPKLYCEECFEKLEEWVDVGTKGTVYTFTIAFLDEHGEKLEKPEIYALIKFKGTYGGIVHRLGEVKPENVRIGMKVQAVFKPLTERKGTINDIAYFKPIME